MGVITQRFISALIQLHQYSTNIYPMFVKEDLKVEIIKRVKQIKGIYPVYVKIEVDERIMIIIQCKLK